MEKIYSKVEDDVLLAIITRLSDFDKPRNEIVPVEEFLQGALICVEDGNSFRPHKHIWKDFNSQYGYNQIQTQECWFVHKGLIAAIIYDVDDTIVKRIYLKEGDTCFLLHGGHAFCCLENGSKILEVKNGPYEGQAKDKKFIDEQG
jgi:hypothetical protein